MGRGLEFVVVFGFGSGVVAGEGGPVRRMRVIDLREHELCADPGRAFPDVANLRAARDGARIFLDPIHDLQAAIWPRRKPDQQVHWWRLHLNPAVAADHGPHERVGPVGADLGADVARVPER